MRDGIRETLGTIRNEQIQNNTLNSADLTT